MQTLFATYHKNTKYEYDNVIPIGLYSYEEHAKMKCVELIQALTQDEIDTVIDPEKIKPDVSQSEDITYTIPNHVFTIKKITVI